MFALSTIHFDFHCNPLYDMPPSFAHPSPRHRSETGESAFGVLAASNAAAVAAVADFNAAFFARYRNAVYPSSSAAAASTSSTPSSSSSSTSSHHHRSQSTFPAHAKTLNVSQLQQPQQPQQQQPPALSRARTASPSSSLQSNEQILDDCLRVRNREREKEASRFRICTGSINVCVLCN